MTDFDKWYIQDSFLADSDSLSALKRAYETGAASEATQRAKASLANLERLSSDNQRIELTDGLSSAETLRDKFAGDALTGLCAKPEFQATYRHYVKCSYRLADAMLEARKLPEAESLVTNGDFSNECDGWSTPEAVNQWQPIETAPKDRTGVLAYDAPNDWQCEAWWDADEMVWQYPVGTISPTHWMPLPAAPEGGE
jgi:hypothetical protein